MAAEVPVASTSTSTVTGTVSNGAVPSPAGASDASTILSTLHTLLRAHVASHPSPTLPYLHPFAPLSLGKGWKGKARAGGGSPEEQAASLKNMREAVELAKNILTRGSAPPSAGGAQATGDKDRVRLARAMREVIAHESVLLPLGTTLAALPPATRPLGSICNLPPAELFSALGKRLGLQVFTEDSQFGLLRKSLTLAGARFVVDVDFEEDASDDKSEDAGTPAEPLSANGGPAAPVSTPALAERGKVRLAKLSANHVTPTGDAGKSDWVGKVLRIAVDQHLANWNAKNLTGRETALDQSARALETTLSELKALDELAEAASKDDADIFADLETLAAGVQRICKDGEDDDDNTWRVYSDCKSAMFPSFRLLDAPPGLHNPAFHLRPVGLDESVTPPPNEDSNAPPKAVGDDAMAVDGNPSTSTTSAMCKGKWLLEFIDDGPIPSSAGRGLIVRRTWLIAGPEEGETSAWAPSIKVEGLLHQAAKEAEGTPAAPVFPLGAEYVHSSSPVQHWTLGAPGPEGYVVGRIGLPANWAAFGQLIRALRDQLVLDVLFMTAFAPSSLSQPPEDSGDDDNDSDVDMGGLDELEKAPTDIAITATLHQRCMRVALPRDDCTVMLEFSPSSSPPYVAVSASVTEGANEAELVAKVGSNQEVTAGGPDSEEIVRRVLALLGQ